MKRIPYTKRRVFQIIITLLLGAALNSTLFSQEPDKVKHELFDKIDTEIQRAKQEGVPELSPTLYAEAFETYRKADTEYKEGERLEKIRKRIAEAMAGLSKAVEAARITKVTLAKVLEARRQVALYEFIRKQAPKEFSEAERHFREAIQKAEKGDIRGAPGKSQSALKSYREATILALEKGPVKEAANELKQSKKTLSRARYAEAEKELKLLIDTIHNAKNQEFEISVWVDEILAKMTVVTLNPQDKIKRGSQTKRTLIAGSEPPVTVSTISKEFQGEMGGSSAGHKRHEETDLHGKFMIFAETVSTSDYLESNTDLLNQNIYMRIGHYFFSLTGNQVRLRYFIFNGKLNKKPSPSPSTYRPDHPDLPQNYCKEHGKPASKNFAGRKIQRPVYSDFIDITGTWETEYNLVRMTFLNTVHEWIIDNDDPSLLRTNKPFYNNENGTHIIDGVTYYNNFGFAYLSDIYKIPDINIRKDHFYDRYIGENFHHNAIQNFYSGWEYKSDAELNLLYFIEAQSNVLVYTLDKYKQNHMLQYNLLLNDAPHSNLIIYYDFGYDFNDNMCFDDYGHTQFMWGIWDSDSNKISRIIFIEYSYQFNGKPMFTVGRYAALR